MPVYNGEDYIAWAVESVFAQDVDLELLVIDDGSTDGTFQALVPYMDRKDFRYLKNDRNLGAAGSRNRGVRKAQGAYIAFLDADDWWEKGKLSQQLEVLRRTGRVLCSTGRQLMRPDGTDTGKYIPVKETITYGDLLSHNSINCSSVLVKRRAILRYPMEHDDSHEDYITWLRILKEYGPAAGIDRPLLKYRLSQGGKSRNKLKSARMTYRAYRYVGYGNFRSVCFFISYALHGLWKYRRPLAGHKRRPEEA